MNTILEDSSKWSSKDIARAIDGARREIRKVDQNIGVLMGVLESRVSGDSDEPEPQGRPGCELCGEPTCGSDVLCFYCKKHDAEREAEYKAEAQS